jgi:long-chain acyl-CoA synthetase
MQPAFLGPGSKGVSDDMRQASEESSSSTAPRTLVDLVRAALGAHDRPVLFERDGAGVWAALSASEVLARAAAIAAALHERGLSPGDRIALMSPNRVDWIVANLGILFAGCVTVPIYATQALDQVGYILADSAARALFVDTPDVAERLRRAGIDLAPIVFDAPAGDAAGLDALIARGRALHAADPAALDRTAAGLAAGDLAVLIYTSGTTGQPKGVMLSHGNVASNAWDAFSLIPEVIEPGDPVLSVLPFAHIYENTNLFGYFLRGAEVYVNRQVERLLEDLRAVRPVVVFAVPRIFERTYAGIVAKSREAGGLKARLVPWALDAGMRYKRAQLNGKQPAAMLRVEFALAHALVLGKIRPQLGCDRLRFFVSGSAALHLDIALVFAGADMAIMEGYGLSECSPTVTVNRPQAARLGTVGTPIPNVEVRLAEDGEILVRGPNVMLGYYNRPAETNAMIREGWLATGDIGALDSDGYLRVVDRKKEIFKTSGGKYVSPARVENAIARSRFVVQVAVFGSDKPHPAALISPNWPALRESLALPESVPNADLARRRDVREFLAAECARETAELGSFEQIRWAGVLPRDLTIDDGELTPTLKVRRRVVEERYAVDPERALGRLAREPVAGEALLGPAAFA